MLFPPGKEAGVYGNRTHRELCSNPPLVLKTRAAARRANTPEALFFWRKPLKLQGVVILHQTPERVHQSPPKLRKIPGGAPSARGVRTLNPPFRARYLFRLSRGAPSGSRARPASAGSVRATRSPSRPFG